MSTGNLLQLLRVDELHPAELRVVLESYYGKSRHDGGDVIEHLRNEEPALVVRYRNGCPYSIEAGPAYRDDDLTALLARIEGDLIADEGTRVRRTIIFSLVPSHGTWRYRDVFQLMPAPPDAPRPPTILGLHPLVLEARYAHSPNGLIANMRSSRVVHEVCLLLSGLVPRIVDRSRDQSVHEWVLPMDDEGVRPDSIWAQVTYIHHGFSHVAEDFSDAQGDAFTIEPDDEYYAVDGIDVTSTVTLPATLSEQLDRYHDLDEDRQLRFLRWCFWLNHYARVWHLSRSAAYMAVIQAVEALRPRVQRSPRCDACGQETGSGSTQQFIDFMDRYVPLLDDEGERERVNLYRLRSGLTHGGKLLHLDLEHGFGAFHPEPLGESHQTRRASRLARLAGVNWVRESGE